ncbi:MAG: hypothetical protein A2W34_06985 [Chloroflexi bacterium RBG_16_64_32]|nr:MAG: hypothetical protein A2W34_06985 [Chloroflexi bacterium RBG_16_64_32]
MDQLSVAVKITGELRIGEMRIVFNGQPYGTAVYVNGKLLKRLLSCELAYGAGGSAFPRLRLEIDAFDAQGELEIRQLQQDDESASG